MTGPQGMGPLSGGGVELTEKFVSIGPMPVIEALAPRIYHPLDVYHPTLRYIDYGTAATPMKQFNVPSGTSAPPHPMSEQLPFESAARLTVANNECFSTHGVTYGLTSTTHVTYSAFVKLVDPFPRAGTFMAVFGNAHTQQGYPQMSSQLSIGVNGEIRWHMYTVASSSAYQSGPVIPNDQEWHMISVVYSSSGGPWIRMYVDGFPVFHQHNEQGNIFAVNNDAIIEKSWGAFSNSNNSANMTVVNPFNGWIVHGFVMLAALTDEDIRAVYEGAFFSPSLVGPPFVIGAGTPQWQLGNAAMVVPVPPGSSAGDTLFLHVSSRDSATTWSGVSGWTLVDHASVSGGTAGVDMSEIWTRTATGVGSYTVTPSIYQWNGAYIVACSGVSSISAVQRDVRSTSSTLNGNKGPLTTAPPGAVVLDFIAWRFGRTPDWTLLTTYSSPPWTQLMATQYPGPNAQAMGCAWARGRGEVPVGPGPQWKYGEVIESRPSHVLQFYLT